MKVHSMYIKYKIDIKKICISCAFVANNEYCFTAKQYTYGYKINIHIVYHVHTSMDTFLLYNVYEYVYGKHIQATSVQYTCCLEKDVHMI